MVRSVLIPLAVVLIAAGALIYAITKPTASPSQAAALRRQVAALRSEVASLSLHAAHETWHVIGAGGQPSFQNGFTNVASLAPKNPYLPTAGFYKDPFDVVHLRGLINTGGVEGGSNSTLIFTLPPGYRPPKNLTFAVFRGHGTGELNINPGGAVFFSTGSGDASLDGVTFRVSK
jgi:hypothetical protein